MKKINKNRFFLYREDALGNGGRTPSTGNTTQATSTQTAAPQTNVKTYGGLTAEQVDEMYNDGTINETDYRYKQLKADRDQAKVDEVNNENLQEYLGTNNQETTETNNNVSDEELNQRYQSYWERSNDPAVLEEVVNKVNAGDANDDDIFTYTAAYANGKVTPGPKTREEIMKHEFDSVPGTVILDWKQNSAFGGKPFSEIQRITKEVKALPLAEQNKLRQEYARGNNSDPKYFIANALLNSPNVLIKATGDTSNTRVAQEVVDNNLSGDSNIVEVKEEEKTSTGNNNSGNNDGNNGGSYDSSGPSYDDIINDEFSKGNLGYPSVYTSFKNGLFGDPNSPEAKQTFTSFLIDHIAKTFGNRNIWRYNPASKSVNMVKGSDLGGQQSLFDEKIKKDWAAQIERNNESEKDLLKAKTKAITDRIELFSGIKNNREAVDYAKQFKKLTDKDIEHAINIMDSAKLNDGSFSAEDFYFLSNPEKAKEWVKLMNDAKLDAAQKQNIALGLSNSILNDSAWISKNTKSMKVLQEGFKTTEAFKDIFK